MKLPSCRSVSLPIFSMRCSATAPTPPVSGQHIAPQLFTYAVVGLTFTLPVGPLEVSALGMEPCDSATSGIEARLVSPSASALVLTRVPFRLHADRPLELELAAVGPGAVDGAAESIASWISAHACLAIAVEVPGQPRGEVTLPFSARPCDGGWIARALVRPASWADAASVTVVSLSLADRLMACDCLPATLRVGYNHARVTDGSVFAAAKVGDVAALQAALDAGGSTEEADEVRGGRVACCDTTMQLYDHRLLGVLPFLLPFYSTAGHPRSWPLSIASRPSARSCGRRQRGRSRQGGESRRGMRKDLLEPCKGAARGALMFMPPFALLLELCLLECPPSHCSWSYVSSSPAPAEWLDPPAFRSFR